MPVRMSVFASMACPRSECDGEHIDQQLCSIGGVLLDDRCIATCPTFDGA